MTTMTRRAWLQSAAATAGSAVLAEAGQARTPSAPKPGYASRPAGKIEILAFWHESRGSSPPL